VLEQMVTGGDGILRQGRTGQGCLLLGLERLKVLVGLEGGRGTMIKWLLTVCLHAAD
jgi:hypothetical protein